MCVFCNIVNGEIPSYKVYEDEFFLAFLDLSQATIGHLLVIPKKHYENIFTLDPKMTSELMAVIIKISNRLKDVLGISSLNILNNSGPLAGQTVDHFHIHLIPRYPNDNLVIEFTKNQLSKEELETLLNKIKF